MKTPSELRQAWLEQCARGLRPHFKKVGYDVPAKIRVSIGWPKGKGGRGTAIGQCWDDKACSDKHFEIFISPALKDSEKIVGVMAHEMVHATVGIAVGHKGPFKQCAEAIGLEGKMTATTNGPDMAAFAKKFITKAGKYPSGAIDYSARKVQGTRLVKCECGECGYIARTTAKWIEEAGTPLCPCNEQPMGV